MYARCAYSARRHVLILFSYIREAFSNPQGVGTATTQLYIFVLALYFNPLYVNLRPICGVFSVYHPVLPHVTINNKNLKTICNMVG